MSMALRKALEGRIDTLKSRISKSDPSTQKEKIAALESALPFLSGRQKSAFEKQIGKLKSSVKEMDTTNMEKELKVLESFHAEFVLLGPDYNVVRQKRGGTKGKGRGKK